MRYYVVLAVFFVIVGLVIAVWLLPDITGWRDLPLDERIPVATLIIGLLALGAALVTILAAVAEIRQVFPNQTVAVSSTQRILYREELEDDTYQLIVENPGESPIINATRIHVRLVRSSTNLSDAGWRRQ